MGRNVEQLIKKGSTVVDETNEGYVWQVSDINKNIVTVECTVVPLDPLTSLPLVGNLFEIGDTQDFDLAELNLKKM